MELALILAIIAGAATITGWGICAFVRGCDNGIVREPLLQNTEENKYP